MMDAKNVNGVMNLLRQAQEVHLKSADVAKKMGSEVSVSGNKFSQDVLNAIREINETQQQAADTKARFEFSDEVPITQVVLDSQKASIAFEATLQVRNKVLKAYQDIMSMPV